MICAVRTTLLELIDRYFLVHNLSWGKDSANQLRTAVRSYEKMLGRPATLQDLEQDALAAWLHWLLHTRQRSPATVRSKRQNLLQLWRCAYRLKLIPDPPSELPIVRDPEPDPASWRPLDLEMLLPQARAWKVIGRAQASVLWSGRWMEALLLVLYETGERIGALRHLKRSAFVPATASLYVPAGVRKGRRKTRHYGLRPATCDLLSELLAASSAEQCELLFPYLGSTESLRRILTGLLKKSGLPHDRWSKFHRFRRTHATQIAAATDEQTAQKALSHSTPAITARYINRAALPPTRYCDLLPQLSYDDPRQGLLF